MPNMLNQIADIKQLSDYELKLLGTIAEEKAKQKGAQIKQSIDDKLNKAGQVGKNLYDLTFGSIKEPQQPQPVAQPVQQPQVQTPPVQTPSAQVAAPQVQQAQPAVQRPVQRPVVRPQQRVVQPAPVQQQQQETEPNIVTDMLNMYMQPSFRESVANSSPVAGEITDQTNEAIAQGEAQAQNRSNTVADILNQIRTGYSDNRDNGFALENLQADPTKTGWNRFGEALGTATRMAGNPLVQGLIAGGINGAINKDLGKGLEYGLQYAQNKAKSDAYERAMGRRPSILGGYGVEDYKAKNEADYKKNKIDIENQELDLKKIKSENETKNIESQIEHRKNQDSIGWARVQEQIRNNKARLAESASNHAAMRAIQQSRILDSQAKFAFTIESKQYTNARNIIMNDKTLNDEQKAKQIYALDNNFANNIRDKYGIDYRSVKEQVSNSGTKPQTTKNTKPQVNTSYKKADGDFLA